MRPMLTALLVALVAAGCSGGHRAETATVRIEAVGAATPANLADAQAVIRRRLDLLGARDASVRRDGRILTIELPRARVPPGWRLLAVQGRLEFFDLEAARVAGPAGAPPPGRPRAEVVTCGRREVVCPGVVVSPPRRTSYYVFREPPILTGRDLVLSGTRFDRDPQTNEPIVLLQFTTRGNRLFREVTRREWLRGRLRRTPQHFAIVLDREIRSFPFVDYREPALRNGITGPVEIVGLRSAGEAKQLAIVLQTGALPLRFRVVG